MEGFEARSTPPVGAEEETAAKEPVSTQDRIRQGSLELFAERGYGGTSIADIADRVGLSKAGLYNYYSSKEELLLELLKRSLEAWTRASRLPLHEEGSCRERLWRHLCGAVDFTARRPHDVAIVRLAATQIGGELGQRTRALLSERKRSYLDLLEEFFTEALRRGEVVSGEPVDLALTWRAFIDGLLINLIFPEETKAPFEERLAALWEIYWRGLSGRPEEAP